MKLFNKNENINIDVNCNMLIVFDETNEEVQERLNVILLWTRCYIYQGFIQQENITFPHLMKYIKLKMNMLKLEAKLEGRTEDFERRWKNWLKWTPWRECLQMFYYFF